MSDQVRTSPPGEPLLEVVPLGGLGEFGLNVMAVSYAETLLAVDAGSMFPEPELLGVDLIIPDLTYLKQSRARHKALVLTHGHEDHIGAVPHVLEFIDGPILATPLTMGGGIAAINVATTRGTSVMVHPGGDPAGRQRSPPYA